MVSPFRSAFEQLLEQHQKHGKAPEDLIFCLDVFPDHYTVVCVDITKREFGPKFSKKYVSKTPSTKQGRYFFRWHNGKFFWQCSLNRALEIISKRMTKYFHEFEIIYEEEGNIIKLTAIDLLTKAVLSVLRVAKAFDELNYLKMEKAKKMIFIATRDNIVCRGFEDEAGRFRPSI